MFQDPKTRDSGRACIISNRGIFFICTIFLPFKHLSAPPKVPFNAQESWPQGIPLKHSSTSGLIPADFKKVAGTSKSDINP